MPPVMGIAAFVMAEFLQRALCRGRARRRHPGDPVLHRAVHPGRSRSRAQPYPADGAGADTAASRRCCKAGWHFPIPFVGADLCVVLGRRGGRGRRPDRHRGRARPRAAYSRSRASASASAISTRCCAIPARLVIDLFMIGAAAGIMIGALNYSGAGFTLSLVLIHLAGGSSDRAAGPGRRSPTSSWARACRPSAATSCSRRWWRRA